MDDLKELTNTTAKALDDLCKGLDVEYALITYDKNSRYYLVSDTAVDTDLVEVLKDVMGDLDNPNRVGMRRQCQVYR